MYFKGHFVESHVEVMHHSRQMFQINTTRYHPQETDLRSILSISSTQIFKSSFPPLGRVLKTNISHRSMSHEVAYFPGGHAMGLHTPWGPTIDEVSIYTLLYYIKPPQQGI